MCSPKTSTPPGDFARSLPRSAENKNGGEGIVGQPPLVTHRKCCVRMLGKSQEQRLAYRVQYHGGEHRVRRGTVLMVSPLYNIPPGFVHVAVLPSRPLSLLDDTWYRCRRLRSSFLRTTATADFRPSLGSSTTTVRWILALLVYVVPAKGKEATALGPHGPPSVAAGISKSVNKCTHGGYQKSRARR